MELWQLWELLLSMLTILGILITTFMCLVLIVAMFKILFNSKDKGK